MIKRSRLSRIAALFAAVVLLTQTMLCAEPGPLYLEEPPSFAAAPVSNSKVVVLENQITFRVNSAKSNWASVKNSYQIENLSSEQLTLPIAMPFISQVSDGFLEDIKISLNGETVPYVVRRLSDLDLSAQNIAEYLQLHPEYADVRYLYTQTERREESLTVLQKGQLVDVYTISLANGENTEFQISSNSSDLKLLFNNFRAMSFENGQWQMLASYDETNRVETAQVAVVNGGSEQFITFSGISEDKIIHSQKTVESFLAEDIFAGYKKKMEENTPLSQDETILYFLTQIGKRISLGDSYVNLTEIAGNYTQSSYVGLVLCGVALEPQSKYELTITYNTQASTEQVSDEISNNIFRYSFQPLQSWASCHDISVEIIPNTYAPYLDESSLPLEKTEEGSYTASFEQLPSELLSFTTSEIDRSRHSFTWLWWAVPLFVLIGAGVSAVWLFFRQKTKGTRKTP